MPVGGPGSVWLRFSKGGVVTEAETIVGNINSQFPKSHPCGTRNTGARCAT